MKTLRRLFRIRPRKPLFEEWISQDLTEYLAFCDEGVRELAAVYLAAQKRTALNRHLEDMRILGRYNLALARTALHLQVDGLYADLGLVRDQHITRGES